MTDLADPPIATVDAVVFTVDAGRLRVLLHKRPEAPHAGVWALPGGYIRPAEDSDTTASITRILRDKTGAAGFYLEQLATYSGAARDPRGWSLSVAHLALVPREKLHLSADRETSLTDVATLPNLAFDHARIIAEALARLRGKGVYSTMPATLLGESFTLSELHAIYEAVLGTSINAASFRRKIQALDVLEDTGEKTGGPSRRPAALYRLRDGVRTFTGTQLGAG